ncbi:pali-domain-containing protein [Mycena amicta]|nr:pali-domain-containing protein [Mycena amicta]
MSRKLFIIGTSCLAVALFLSLIGSISLPRLPAIDYTRVKFSGVLRSGQDALTQVRWGIWGPCLYDENNKRFCFDLGHGYALPLITNEGQIVIIGGSWTRGLAIHPVATAIIAIALGLSFATFEAGPLIASLTAMLAAVILLIAFAIDIALFAYVHHKVGTLKNVSGNVDAGTAFWFTLVELILVLVASVTVCLGRRKDGGGDSYPMFSNPSGGFFSRFKK